MKFGFGVPVQGPFATPDNIVRVAKHGEALGFDYCYVSDHLVIPSGIKSPYPYSKDGSWPRGKIPDYYEAVTLLAFLAAATTRVRLVTNVLIVPYRDPIVTAKMLACIDVLSKGRVTLGVGVGWMKEEFEALGLPPFAERGKVTDEYVRAFKEIWTSDTPRFKGDYVSFGNISIAPKPLQKSGLPIWVGGESPPALRRAAALGDAWYPVGNSPKFPMDTAERYGRAAAELRRLTEAAGRRPDAVALSYFSSAYTDTETLKATDGSRHAFTGTDDDIVEDLARFGAIGLANISLNFRSASLDEMLTRMDRFATKIRPRFKG
ncbi:MAG: LLM class F420-dependent oxidoreductase [Alphaproteobacteria bacterium]